MINLTPKTINIDEYINIENKKYGFPVDKGMFNNTVLRLMVFKVLSIYCSIICIMNFIIIIVTSSLEDMSKIRPQRQNLQKSNNQFHHFGYTLDVYLGLLNFQEIRSN